MTSTHNGVTKTATGDLLRAGYTDFENDGSFDAATETFHTDVPLPAYTTTAKKEGTGEFYNWNGSAWSLTT